MRQGTLASVVLAVVLTAFIAGCAGPMARSAQVVPASFDEHLVRRGAGSPGPSASSTIRSRG